jgi:hypothetical protein
LIRPRIVPGKTPNVSTSGRIDDKPLADRIKEPFNLLDSAMNNPRPPKTRITTKRSTMAHTPPEDRPTAAAQTTANKIATMALF